MGCASSKAGAEAAAKARFIAGATSVLEPPAQGKAKPRAWLRASVRADKKGPLRSRFSPLSSPPRKQRQENVRIDKDAHKAIPLLMALDDPLEAALKSGALKLVSAEYMRSAEAGGRILSRQGLEELERTTGVKIFLTATEAIDALRANGRLIGALTSGWSGSHEPDCGGHCFAAVRRFLHSADGAHIVGIFWDFASLPRASRSKAESMPLKHPGREVLGLMFASAMGTTVMRHKGVPPMDPSQEGKLVVIAEPGSAIDTETALKDALGVHGEIESVSKDADAPGEWLVHFASHASVEAAVAAGLESASAIFPMYKGLEYGKVRAREQRPGPTNWAPPSPPTYPAIP